MISATAIVLTLADASPYGTANQATYLLDPLQRAVPELFQRDWFVAETPPYLPVFGWLAQWLFRIDPEGTTAVLGAHVVVMLATFAALYWLIRAVSSDVRVFVLLAAFTAITLGRAMGGSYLFAPYFQPSSLATLGWICALAALLRGRYLTCGIALALGGAVHPNFLVLGFGLFALAGLARRDVCVGQVARLLGPQLVVLAWYLPDLLATAGIDAEATRILVEFHAPGHYAGCRLAVRIPELAIWLVAARGALELVPERTRAMRILWRFSWLAAAIAIVAALVIMVPPMESLTRVYWSRVAPYAQLGCQLLVASALIHRAPAVTPRVVVLAMPIVIAVVVTFPYLHATAIATIVAALVIVLAFVPLPHTRTLVPIVTLFAALWISPRGHGLTTTPHGRPSELELVRWAREHTPIDALFVAPPDLGRFRLLARRAIVVDSKSPPLRSDLLVQWYGRMCALVQVSSARSVAEISAHYGQLAPTQLSSVARSFDADYIIVRANAAHAWPTASEFANDRYAVYRVRQ